MTTLDDDYQALTERQREALPLVFAVLGAACVSYDVDDVIALVHLISRHPRLLSETIGLTAEALDGKEGELQRRFHHPTPHVVDDSQEPEAT